MQPKITPVILSGGSGTRLWPLSRALRPKQLLPLVSDRSMLQQTIERTADAAFGPPLIVCNEEHRFMIAEQVRTLGVRPEAILLEPSGRNTAPAVAVAAMYLAEKDQHSDGIMVILPSDHVVADQSAFLAAVRTAVAAARGGALVSFGIRPQRAETGYGYIRRGAPLADAAGCYRIDAFIEKPDVEAAKSYVADERFSWNSGMFVFPVGGFLDELERLAPQVFAAAARALAGARRDLDFVRLDRDPFLAAESISIDYAVMEKTAKGAVVPADMGWSDVGSWSALWQISEHDSDGNVVLGDVATLDARNCYIRSDSRLIAAVGVEELVIVGTDDAVLVARMDRDQDVKRVVEEIARAGRNEHAVPRQVFRPWGWYRNLHEGHRFQVKEIVVQPGEKLSAQMHHHRSEHWIVVSGTAKVTKDGQSFFITENQSTYIPNTTEHCLENPGRIPLKMIEVQSGPYLGEDDIIRFEDRYGRAAAEAAG